MLRKQKELQSQLNSSQPTTAITPRSSNLRFSASPPLSQQPNTIETKLLNPEEQQKGWKLELEETLVLRGWSCS